MSPTFPLLPQGAVPTARTWGAFFSGKEPAPHPGRKAPGRFDFALDPQRHKGRGLRPSPFGNPLPGTGDGSEAPAFGNPSRSWTGERQRKEGQGASCLEHWCAADFLVRGHSSGRNRYSAAGRGVSSLVGSAWRPAPVLGELTVSSVNSSLTFFLFHRARRIFFLMSQKENGGCIPTVKPCILVPQSGTMLHPLRRFAAPLCGAKKM